MITLYLYIGFSYFFMLGSALADHKYNKGVGLGSYIVGVLFAPVFFPLSIGYALTSK